MLHKKISILFLYFSFLYSEDFFKNIFPQEKTNIPTTPKPDLSFSSINYKPILEIVKKYRLKGELLDANVIKINQLLVILHYCDLGAVQVFRKQKRNDDFDLIQQATCSIRKNIYEHFFLNKNSFFIRTTEEFALLKNKYLQGHEILNALNAIDFASEYIIKSLKNKLTNINDQTAKDLLEINAKNLQTVNEVTDLHQQKKQNLQQKITNIENSITELNAKIKTIEQDTLNWKSDLQKVEEDKKTSERIALKSIKDTDEINKQLEKINIEKNNILKNIHDIDEKIIFYSSLMEQKKHNQILNLIKSINEYNALIKSDSQSFLGPLKQTIEILQNSDMKTKKANIINTLNTLMLPTISSEKIFEPNNIINNNTLTILKNYTDQQTINENIQSFKNTKQVLEKEKLNLNQQETIQITQLEKLAAEASAELQNKSSEFIHKTIIRNSNEIQTIKEAINTNNEKIKITQEHIAEQKNEIQKLREEIKEHDSIITTTKNTLSKTKKDNDQKIQTQKLELLKKINYTDEAKNYLKNLLDIYSNLSSKDIQKNISNIAFNQLKIAYQLNLLLHNLKVIFNVQVPEDIKSTLLQGTHTEELSVLNTLKHKATALQKEAENKLAVLKAAFFNTQNTSSTQQPTKNKTILNKNDDLYCEIDRSLIENIQVKIAAVKNDLASMITHTLTIAKSIETEYEKLIAIKNIVFTPLCNEYEQLTKVTEPWLKNHQKRVEQINIKNVKKEYANSILFAQSLKDPKDLLITNKDSLVVAQLFFEEVGKELLSKIQTINTTNNERDHQFFRHTLNEILTYELIINTIESTQLKWYAFSKEVATNIKQMFIELKQQILNKKINLALILIPQFSSIEHNQKDIFLNKTNNLDGRLIQTTKKAILAKQFFMQLTTLFHKKIKLKNDQIAISKLQKNITSILKTITKDLDTLKDTLFDQIIKKAYKEIKDEANMILKEIFNTSDLSQIS